MKKLSAVLFDMDGVVVDSMPHHLDSWKSVFKDFNIDLEDSDIYSREGMTGLDSVKEIFIQKGVGIPSDEHLAALIIKKHTHYENKRIKLFPRIKEILVQLKNDNIPAGLVTGSMRRSVTHSISQDVIKMFCTIVTADDVTKGKPDPEPYTTALKQLGSKLDETLVVENAPLGIESAQKAGLFCVAIATTLPLSSLHKADLILPDHVSLLHYLQEKTGIN